MPAPFVTMMLLGAIALAAAGVSGIAVGVLVIVAALLQLIVTVVEAFGGPPDDLAPL